MVNYVVNFPLNKGHDYNWYRSHRAQAIDPHLIGGEKDTLRSKELRSSWTWWEGVEEDDKHLPSIGVSAWIIFPKIVSFLFHLLPHLMHTSYIQKSNKYWSSQVCIASVFMGVLGNLFVVNFPCMPKILLDIKRYQIISINSYVYV